MHFEDVEEEAEETGCEIDGKHEGVGPTEDKAEGQSEEEGIEGDINFSNFLHESFGAGIVLCKLVGLCCHILELFFGDVLLGLALSVLRACRLGLGLSWLKVDLSLDYANRQKDQNHD